MFRDERALSRRDVVDALLSTHVTGDRAEKGLRFQVGSFSQLSTLMTGDRAENGLRFQVESRVRSAEHPCDREKNREWTKNPGKELSQLSTPRGQSREGLRFQVKSRIRSAEHPYDRGQSRERTEIPGIELSQLSTHGDRAEKG